jgi:hypothetical protein
VRSRRGLTNLELLDIWPKALIDGLKDKDVMLTVFNYLIHASFVEASSPGPIVPGDWGLLVLERKELLDVDKLGADPEVGAHSPHAVYVEALLTRTLLGLEEPTLKELGIKELAVVADDKVVALQLITDSSYEEAIIRQVVTTELTCITSEGIRFTIQGLEATTKDTANHGREVGAFEIPTDDGQRLTVQELLNYAFVPVTLAGHLHPAILSFGRPSSKYIP